MMNSHKVTMDWLGESIETLADLWPRAPKAVIVGINPAPVSVSIGHYYQGRMGQALFRRLREAEVLGQATHGYEDDHAVAAGIGFTDVVKRPTISASEVGREEVRVGTEALEQKLGERSVPLVIFSFKQAATTLLGNFKGNGFLSDHTLGGASVFVMPGPYESALTAKKTLQDLRSYWLEN